MTGEQPSYPWWARYTGGNRGFALALAIAWTLLGVANLVFAFRRHDVWLGLISLLLLFLAAWGWSVVVYLNRRSGKSGDRRGW